MVYIIMYKKLYFINNVYDQMNKKLQMKFSLDLFISLCEFEYNWINSVQKLNTV